MSHYVECKPGFKDQQALIEALVAIGFDRSQIELHEEVVPLYGYRGDERPQRALGQGLGSSAGERTRHQRPFRDDR